MIVAAEIVGALIVGTGAVAGIAVAIRRHRAAEIKAQELVEEFRRKERERQARKAPLREVMETKEDKPANVEVYPTSDNKLSAEIHESLKSFVHSLTRREIRWWTTFEYQDGEWQRVPRSRWKRGDE